MSDHLQCGMRCGVPDAFFIHVVLMLSNVFIKHGGWYGKLGIPAPIQDILFGTIDFRSSSKTSIASFGRAMHLP